MQKLKTNNQIILHDYNHSSNIIPWITLTKKRNINIKIINTPNLKNTINNKTKIITFSQLTNNFQIKINIKNLYKKYRKIKTILINNTTQTIIYKKINLQNYNIITFNTNKFYRPTSLKTLIIKKNILKKLNPVTFNDNTINSINKNNNFIIKNNIEKFKPETLNFTTIFIFNKSINFFNQYINYKKNKKILKKLNNYTYDELLKIQNIKIYSKKNNHIILFNIKKINSQNITHFLNINNIYIRSKIFYAHYLKNFTYNDSFVKISLKIYNNKNDINKLTHALKKKSNFIIL